MSKEDFTIKVVEKYQAEEILNNFHYLSKLSKGFKGGEIIGLFKKSEGGLFGSFDKIVGVAVFHNFPRQNYWSGCMDCLEIILKKGFMS